MTIEQKNINVSLKDLKEHEEKHFRPVVAHIRIDDEKNERWTDAYVQITEKHGKIQFELIHEKGYPSEQKGQAYRKFMANWLSKKLPKV